VAGLAAAHYALKNPTFKRIVLLESTERLGGWVKTIRNKDGVIMEKGPRTVRPAGPQGANTLALVQELDLVDSLRPVTYSHPSSTNRMILVNGQLHKLPSNLQSVFRTLPPFSRPLAMSAFTDLMTPRVKCDDISLDEFVSRRLGPELAEFAISSLVRGICAGDSKQVSVHFIAKYLHQMEQETGRISFGVARDWFKSWYQSPEQTPEEQLDIVKKARAERWAIWGLENGLETLIEKLDSNVTKQGVEIHYAANIDDIVKDGNKLVVSGDNLKTLHCDKLIMAAPAFQASQMMQNLSPKVSSLLSSIPFVNVAVVNIQYKGKVLDHQGFGFLVPSSQPDPILGCIYDSCTFPQGDRTLFTVMMGGAWYKDVVGDKSEEEVTKLAVDHVSRILKINAPIHRCHTSLLPQCIAQYTVGHLGRLAKARTLLRSQGLPLELVGSSYDGPGINDTIMSAKRSVIH